MIKAKLVTVFSAIVAVLALSAAPAFAEFQSNSNSTAGFAKTGPLVIEGGGATLECKSAEGEWKIQTAGNLKEHEVGTKQVKALKGPQQYITFTKFAECKAKSKEIKEAKPKVGVCTLHLTQEAGSLTALGAIVSECFIETTVLFLTCKISTPAANETTGVNFNLKKNALENSGSNLIVTAADEGITSEPKGFCPGVSATKEAKEKAVLTEQGVKEV
jgi:hypothetical protein